MKPATKKMLVAIATAAALVLVAYLLYRFFKTRREGFADIDQIEGLNADVKLSPKETELFENLINNKLDDAAIKKLISSGELTDKVVEKFLSKLNMNEEFTDAEDFEEEKAGEGFAEEEHTTEGFAEDEEKRIEGFATGSTGKFASF